LDVGDEGSEVREMPKQKTHKGLKKRVKVTGRGKVKRRKAFTGHLLSGRTRKRLRRLKNPAIVEGKNADRILEALGR
jgi:large subunit ribosomal protein L35